MLAHLRRLLGWLRDLNREPGWAGMWDGINLGHLDEEG